MIYLSHGFHKISKANAKLLNGGKLPRPGYETLVNYDGKYWWLARQCDQGKIVWTIRDAGRWRLVDGKAVIGKETTHAP